MIRFLSINNITIFSITLIFSSTLYSQINIKKTIQFENIKEVVVSNLNGSIVSSTHKLNKVEYQATVEHENPENCQISTRIENDTLELYLDKKQNMFYFWKCKINWKIKIPENMAFRVKNGNGQITLNGSYKSVNIKSGNSDINGISANIKSFDLNTGNGMVQLNKVKDVSIKNGNGDISISNSSGNIEIFSGNSDITIESDGGNFKAKLGNGNVSYSLNKAPNNNIFEIFSGAGKVDISAPRSSKILLSHKGFGKVFSEFQPSNNPDLTVNINQLSGDISLKKNPIGI